MLKIIVKKKRQQKHEVEPEKGLNEKQHKAQLLAEQRYN